MDATRINVRRRSSVGTGMRCILAASFRDGHTSARRHPLRPRRNLGRFDHAHRQLGAIRLRKARPRVDLGRRVARRDRDSTADPVHALRAHGHELAVVTSKSEWLAYRALALVGLASCMETVVGLDASTRHKPDPEPVWIALQRLNCPPEQALFVGDSVHDVMAGNAAGVATVAATWGAFHRTELEPG